MIKRYRGKFYGIGFVLYMFGLYEIVSAIGNHGSFLLGSISLSLGIGFALMGFKK